MRSSTDVLAAVLRQKTFAVPGPTDVRGFLTQALHGVKRSRIAQLVRFGAIEVNGVVVKREAHPLQAGDVLTVTFDGPRSVGGGLTVIYQDADIIVVDKPPGLLTIATDTEREQTTHALLNAWLAPRGGRVWIVHRLDRETSGLLVFARSEAVKHRLQAGWKQAEKGYVAVVEGQVRPPQGTLRSFLRETATLQVVSSPGPDAREAVTEYRVTRSSASHTMLALKLQTGRKHQIRVQLADLGHPIVGDPRYGARSNPIGRLALHAARLTLPHPLLGRLDFSAPVPAIFELL